MKRSELRKRVMRAIKQGGLDLPSKPAVIEDNEEQFPSHLSGLSDYDLRNLISRLAAQVAYAHSYCGLCEVDAVAYKRDAKNYEKMRKSYIKAQLREEGVKNPQVWEIEARLADDPLWDEKAFALEEAEAMLTLSTSLRRAYEAQYAAASRELSARISDPEGMGEA